MMAPMDTRCTLLLFSCSVVPAPCSPMDAAYRASLSFTISWSLLKVMSIESVMPFSHLLLCHPLLLYIAHAHIYIYISYVLYYIHDLCYIYTRVYVYTIYVYICIDMVESSLYNGFSHLRVCCTDLSVF